VTTAKAKGGSVAWRRAVGIAAIAALGGLVWFVGPERLASWAERTREMGAAGAALFIIGYAAAVVALVPASILTLTAGAVFGVVRGALLVFAGATAGAAVAFLLARYVLRETVQRRLRRAPKFQAIDEAVSRSGFTIVLLLRLSPLVPFSLLNYALGITRVRFRDYILGGVGMIPVTLVYVYYGKAFGEVAGVSGGGAPRGPLYWTQLAIGLAATALATWMITRRARVALQQQMQDADA